MSGQPIPFSRNPAGKSAFFLLALARTTSHCVALFWNLIQRFVECQVRFVRESTCRMLFLEHARIELKRDRLHNLEFFDFIMLWIDQEILFLFIDR
jgi:hypothetical protein